MTAKGTPQRLADLSARAGISPELIRLESDLLEWRQSIAGLLDGRYPVGDAKPGSASPGPHDASLAEGECLAAAVDPLPDLPLLRRVADEFMGIVGDRIPAAQPLRRWLERHAASDERERILARWFTAAWRRDEAVLTELAADSAVDADVLEWVGRQICRPFFHRLATLSAAHPGDAGSPRPDCPICGGPPAMARLEREEGRRFLWCSLCNVQWAYRRLACPFCDNREQPRLGFLAIEGQTRHRIDVCEACRGYLRTVDERGSAEGDHTDFWAEDLGTVHLRVVAENQGYWPFGAGDTPQDGCVPPCHTGDGVAE